MQIEQAIAFPTETEPAGLELRINFGVFAGRDATPAELEELAKLLVPQVGEVSLVAEQRHVDAQRDTVVGGMILDLRSQRARLQRQRLRKRRRIELEPQHGGVRRRHQRSLPLRRHGARTQVGARRIAAEVGDRRTGDVDHELRRIGRRRPGVEQHDLAGQRHVGLQPAMIALRAHAQVDVRFDRQFQQRGLLAGRGLDIPRLRGKRDGHVTARQRRHADTQQVIGAAAGRQRRRKGAGWEAQRVLVAAVGGTDRRVAAYECMRARAVRIVGSAVGNRDQQVGVRAGAHAACRLHAQPQIDRAIVALRLEHRGPVGRNAGGRASGQQQRGRDRLQ